MVKRMLDEATGGRKNSQGAASSAGEAFTSPLSHRPSKNEQAEAMLEMDALAASSGAVGKLGMDRSSSFGDDTNALAENIDDFSPEDLQDWATGYQTKHKATGGEYNNEAPERPTPWSEGIKSAPAYKAATRELAEAVNDGDPKKIEAAKKKFMDSSAAYKAESKARNPGPKVSKHHRNLPPMAGF